MRLERLRLRERLAIGTGKKKNCSWVYQPQMHVATGKGHRVGGRSFVGSIRDLGPCATRQVHTNCEEQRD